MRGLATLVTLALVCGVCKPEVHTTKHFETVHSWSAIDYLFPDEEARNKTIMDGTFVPGNSIPWGVDIDTHRGRMFLAIVKGRPGVPASLVTVSDTKNQKGEHLMQPYPDWSWHTKGCDGITSVGKIAIDECDRLWVMDTGSVYNEGLFGLHTQVCPPQIQIFDLKTDQLIKQHKFPKTFVDRYSTLSTIVIEVMSHENECRDTFAYVADAGDYDMIVYDLATDESWVATANEMYPQPEYGRFDIKGVQFDYMQGVYSMALSPKTSTERTLFFNSAASGKENHVPTSVLKRKENFHLYNRVPSEFVTYPHPRPGGQTGSEVMDEAGIMYFNSIKEMKVYCWNHKADYTSDHIIEVDRDDEAFQMFGDMKIVKKDGGSELYILTNSYQKFVYGTPGMEEVLFRVMKAPVQSLIQGTACATDGSNH